MPASRCVRGSDTTQRPPGLDTATAGGAGTPVPPHRVGSRRCLISATIALQAGDAAAQRLQARVTELEAELERRDADVRERDDVIARERQRIDALQDEASTAAAQVAQQLQTLMVRSRHDADARASSDRDLELGTVPS
jgi:hypothetical protein